MGELRAGEARAWTEDAQVEEVVDVLGGSKVFKTRPAGPLDAHDLLLQGLPGAALTHLIDSFALLKDPATLEKAVGISRRTVQRRKSAPVKLLSREQSGRAWKFAEILAKATAVLGSRKEAERWLEREAIGLDRRRPIDLLATTAGVEIVESHLERLEYGVYV